MPLTTRRCRLAPFSAPIAGRRPDALDRYHRPRGGLDIDRLLWGLSPAARLPDPSDPGTRLARLEAVLFLAREPIPSRKLAQLANLADGTEARTLVRQLSKRYDEQASGFQVVEVAGGFQLLTRPELSKWVRRIQQTPIEARLSGPAMETLAVVAYCQPVLRAEVEAIRGVQCGEILRQLMDRDLVRIVGRSSELGRPFLYGSTKRFLQVFGLKHLDDLPRAEQLRRRSGRTARPVENRQAGSHDMKPGSGPRSDAGKAGVS